MQSNSSAPAINWRGVVEEALPSLNMYGYPDRPIESFILSPSGSHKGGQSRVLELLQTGRSFLFEPAQLGAKGQGPTVLIVAEPFQLPGDSSNAICYVILINPAHISVRSDQDKRGKRLDPIVALTRLWPWWFHYERSRLRRFCTDPSAEKEYAEEEASEVFRCLVRLHTLADIVSFANAGLSRRRGDDVDNQERQEDWLRRSVIDIVNPHDEDPAEKGWHNCIGYPWPPCHNGKLADRKLATTLLWFCPWTSGARAKCESVPAELGGKWHELVIKRLCGWVPLKLAKNDRPVCMYGRGVGVDPDRLDEQSLSRLFISDFLRANVHAPYFGAPINGIGLEEKGRCMGHIGRVLHYLLANTALDWRTIEGLVWMIAEYGHMHLGIDHRIDITSHLLHAARTEPPLHAMQAYYRDHFFHAIEVCFLGHLLLITQDAGGRPLWESVADQFRAMRRSGRWHISGTNGSKEGISTLEDVCGLAICYAAKSP